MKVIGITGSIGMGKSTLSAMLIQMGIPVHDSDKSVHKALDVGQPGYTAVAASFPYFEFPQIYGNKNANGLRIIERKALRDLVFSKEELRQRLENILHPLVRDDQKKFIRDNQRKGLKIIGLDIPLLFETGGEVLCDTVLLATASQRTQRKRVLERGIDENTFYKILRSQMGDHEKRQRADHVIHMDLGLAYSYRKLKEIVNALCTESDEKQENEILEDAW